MNYDGLKSDSRNTFVTENVHTRKFSYKNAMQWSGIHHNPGHCNKKENKKKILLFIKYNDRPNLSPRTNNDSFTVRMVPLECE